LRIGWLTDIHLNFAPSKRRNGFYAEVRKKNLDSLLIGGDVVEADSVIPFLSEIENELEMPIYFVLGNHDFYRGSITAVREAVIQHVTTSRWLHWLPASGVVALTPNTALVGHDSWADGHLGDSSARQSS
jgi:predicted phosphodiesterase